MSTLRDQQANSSLWPLLTNVAQLLLLPISALVLVATLESLTHTPASFQGDFSAYTGSSGTQVVLLNTSRPASMETHSLLADRGVKFEERELAASPNWLKGDLSRGCDSAPLVLIGDTLIYGFKPKLIEQQLALEQVLP